MTSSDEQPSWLQTRPFDDGLQMLGHGLDDVDDVPAVNRSRFRDLDHLADVYCVPGVRGGELARALESLGWRPPVDDASHPAAYVVTDGDDELFGAWLNPDCRDGKHSACGGDAWSDELDERVACGCSCHAAVDVAVGGYL